MIEFESFQFCGDRFFQKNTELPLTLSGLTLLKGKNYDASADGSASNGSAKSRLLQILEGFIYGKNPRGNFKKTILSSFGGTLVFKDHKGDRWSFTYAPKDPVTPWTIRKNDIPIKVSHKATDNQEKLASAIGITRDEWGYFVSITQRSLDILIRGKPTERRNYLENFFNIDSFYAQSFLTYNSKWKEIKGELEVMKADCIRLSAIQDAKKDLPNEGWARLQLDYSEDALGVLRGKISEVTAQQSLTRTRIDCWSQYHTLFKQLQGLDAKALKTDYDNLAKSKLELEQKEKARQQLEAFIRTKLMPHQGRKPKLSQLKPDNEKPSQQAISEREISLNQMREKLRLKKQLTPLQKEIETLEPQITNELITLEAQKASLHKSRLDHEEHLSLIKKGNDTCLTCKQPLTHILSGLSPGERKKEIEGTIQRIKDDEMECLRQIALFNNAEKLKQQYAILHEQFSHYPTFGVKLSDAETELVVLKELACLWEHYEKEQETLTKWQTTYDLLMAEAKGYGYPDILSENHQEELARIEEALPQLSLELKRFDRFDVLTEQVLALESLSILEARECELKEDMDFLMKQVEAINEFKGVIRTQIDSLVSLKGQEKVLEAKVAKQKQTESESKILEVLNNFYSPTGFKVYELKKRCQKMIERTNYWSKLFFSEPYTWSLSEDLDDLDFFIQPTHDPETEPYPISLLSSGEYNRAVRVLLFSQLELIPPSKKTNLLILDEIEANLDEVGMLAFTEIVLPTLKATFPEKTIMVISHQTSLHKSGVLDHLMVVERRNRKSTLTVFPEYQRRVHA